MIVDVHGHILRDAEDLEWVAGSGLVSKVWLHALPAFATPRYPGPSDLAFGTDDDVLRAAREFPDVFLPFGYLDFRRGPEAIDAQREAGFVGLKAIFVEKPYDDPSYMGHYGRAAELGMPILFHLGGLGPVRESGLGPGLAARSVNMRPAHLGTIAGNLPDLVCIGAHLGQSWQAEVLECMRCYRNVYFDISGGDTVPIMRWLLTHLGEPCVTESLLVGIDSVYGHREYHENIAEKIRFWESFLKYAGDWYPWTDEGDRILRLNAEGVVRPL